MYVGCNLLEDQTCLGVLEDIFGFCEYFLEQIVQVVVSTAQGLFLEAIPPLVLKAEVRHFSFAM